MLKPILAYFRLQGINAMAYMDDFLGIAPSLQLAEQHCQQMVDVLERLGWVISGKSQLEPMQRIPFLGLILDSNSMTVELPEDKCRKIRLLASSLLCEYIDYYSPHNYFINGCL